MINFLGEWNLENSGMCRYFAPTEFRKNREGEAICTLNESNWGSKQILICNELFRRPRVELAGNEKHRVIVPIQVGYHIVKIRRWENYIMQTCGRDEIQIQIGKITSLSDLSNIELVFNEKMYVPGIDSDDNTINVGNAMKMLIERYNLPIYLNDVVKFGLFRTKYDDKPLWYCKHQNRIPWDKFDTRYLKPSDAESLFKVGPFINILKKFASVYTHTDIYRYIELNNRNRKEGVFYYDIHTGLVTVNNQHYDILMYLENHFNTYGRISIVLV